ncbi:MAG: GNAT family N-acetyltransferase [Coxiellaceae bacterium]|nr:GNAT family N-acetyltransferase [Coxiellaceae bacterium]
MIYFIIGASGSGKSACLVELQKRLPEYKMHDFDDIGVPDDADRQWRQKSTEKWIAKLAPHSQTENTILLGQMVPGEILASPSAAQLNKFKIILLDCSDQQRVQRLKLRGDKFITQDVLNWASWLRMHCSDPQWQPHVIKQDAWGDMQFECWQALRTWPGNVQLNAIDTTNLSIKQVVDTLYKIIDLADVTIKKLNSTDIEALSKAFINENYYKPVELFQRYLTEQDAGMRSVWSALNKDGRYLAYVTVLWSSGYALFADNNVPEINDFNVVPSQQGRGIGKNLLDFIEGEVAREHNRVGLGVGLFKDYGMAQSLYVRCGYVPNKDGVTSHLEPVVAGKSYAMDDDLILWLTKELNS